MNQLYKNIGNRISTLRHNKKVTQVQLAELLDISVKHCSSVERGLSCLSIEKLVLLCDILDTDLDYLIRGIDINSQSQQIPNYILEIYNGPDEQKKQLLNEYILLFKRLTSE